MKTYLSSIKTTLLTLALSLSLGVACAQVNPGSWAPPASGGSHTNYAPVTENTPILPIDQVKIGGLGLDGLLVTLGSTFKDDVYIGYQYLNNNWQGGGTGNGTRGGMNILGTPTYAQTSTGQYITYDADLILDDLKSTSPTGYSKLCIDNVGQFVLCKVPAVHGGPVVFTRGGRNGTTACTTCTWTPPAGATSVTITAYGGGGGGADGCANGSGLCDPTNANGYNNGGWHWGAGGGGGAGGITAKVVSVPAGGIWSPLSLSVGAGGKGGNGDYNSAGLGGNNGVGQPGTSTVINGSFGSLTAAGGGGGEIHGSSYNGNGGLEGNYLGGTGTKAGHCIAGTGATGQLTQTTVSKGGTCFGDPYITAPPTGVGIGGTGGATTTSAGASMSGLDGTGGAVMITW